MDQPDLFRSFPPQRPNQLGKMAHYEPFKLVRFVVGVRLEQFPHIGRRVDPRQGENGLQLFGAARQEQAGHDGNRDARPAALVHVG